MSLPTNKPPLQSSIRSFFTPKPSFAPPPSTTTTPPPAPPPPPAAAAEATRQSALSARRRLEDATARLPTPTVDAPIPPLPPSVTLPTEAAIRPLAPEDVQSLKRINALLLPVNYGDSFYARAVDPSASGRFSRAITWTNPGEAPKVVGGVVARLEPTKEGMGLYVQSLCLLSPYRGLGLITAAVDNIIATAAVDPKLDVRVVTAHVWTENDDGMRWYERHQFRRVGDAIPGYYLKLRPDSAWLVLRQVGADVRGALGKLTINDGAGGGSPVAGSPRPPLPSPGQSYQNQRAETEWNDLPADMAPTLPQLKKGSEPGSTASSRSSSAVRKKRDRSYPAAAFKG